MAYNNGYIQAPVSIADVARAVPVTLKRTNSSTGQTERRSSRDLGVLCGASIGDTITASDGKGNWTVESRGEINKWSKYKPVKLGKISTVDEWNASSNAWKSDATWFTGVIGNVASNSRYGMNFPLYSVSSGSMSDFCTKLIDAENKNMRWTYQKPTGGTNFPFRLTDFAGYQQVVSSPLPRCTERIGIVSQEGLMTYVLELDDYELGNLTLADIRSLNGTTTGTVVLENMYAGILLYNSDGTRYWRTAEQPMSDSSLNKNIKVTLEVSAAWRQKATPWYTRAFLCTQPLAKNASPSTTTAQYLLPCDDPAVPITFMVASVLEVSSMSAKRITGSHVIVTVELTNGKTKALSLTDIYIELLSESGLELETYTFASVSIAANQRMDFDHTWTSSRALNATSAHFHCVSNDGDTIDQTIPITIK